MRYISLFFLFISFSVFSQQKSNLDEGRFVVSGTSTLHDWDMETSEIKAEIEYATDGSGSVQEILSLKLNFPAESLKSGRRRMDNNAYKALKTDEFRSISFELISSKVLSNDNGGVKMRLNGNLRIAGSNKQMPFEALVNVRSGKINIKGQTTFKMSDFDVTPPEFMMGAMKTGDEIEVAYDLTF